MYRGRAASSLSLVLVLFSFSNHVGMTLMTTMMWCIAPLLQLYYLFFSIISFLHTRLQNNYRYPEYVRREHGTCCWWPKSPSWRVFCAKRISSVVCMPEEPANKALHKCWVVLPVVLSAIDLIVNNTKGSRIVGGSCSTCSTRTTTDEITIQGNPK